LYLPALALLPGCGDDGGQLVGPFVRIMGMQNTIFSLDRSVMEWTCKPKPGLKEFEFEAAQFPQTDAGNYLRFTIRDYNKPQVYEMEYGTGANHSLEVGFDSPNKHLGEKSYKYTFGRHFRSDTTKEYLSKCTINMDWIPLGNVYRYFGTIDCIMLFAGYNSKDYLSGNMNTNVDMVAKFECDH